MHPEVCSTSAGLFRVGLVCAGLLLATGRTSGGDLPGGYGWQNFEFRTYAPNSIREIADCKVEKIFLDHRKIGFFRVRLLPVLVVQGVRLEFGAPSPTNDWALGFRSDWLPKVEHSSVEWRDISIGSRTPGSPRLHAGVAQPAATGSPEICEFRDVTLTANGVTRRLARAELRDEGGRPHVVWPEEGGVERCDLFNGETPDNPKSNGAKK